ncbi:MAG: ribbon-helix-helix protein, CopG family [Prochlorothrix sp.]|nr:ribbon-helix-helix protein, CopG family [Prochlorothrix sp.]
MSAPSPQPQETLTLQIPTSLDAQLAQAAASQHRSKSELVLEALAQYLSQDRTVATALDRLEKSLTQRFFALETKFTVLERQVSVSQSAAVDRRGYSAAVTPAIDPTAEQIDDDELDDGIDDEPDEILWDFMPPEGAV